MKRATQAAVALCILALQSGSGRAAEARAQARAVLPNPVLRFARQEEYTAGEKHWVRHRYDVLDKDRYPETMFAPSSFAPSSDLPPCGLNTKSSRSWVDFFDSHGKRLYGFCALASPKDLASIWFATEAGTGSPARVYIEITDRQTGLKYKSNLTRTEPPAKARPTLKVR